MSKRMLMYLLVGGAVYWFILRRRGGGSGAPMRRAMPVRPTDSMMPGSLMPAVQGVIKNGQSLEIMQ